MLNFLFASLQLMKKLYYLRKSKVSFQLLIFIKFSVINFYLKKF